MDFFRQFRKKNLDRVEPMTKSEIIAFYVSDGILIPPRFRNLPEAERNRIINSYTTNHHGEVNT